MGWGRESPEPQPSAPGHPQQPRDRRALGPGAPTPAQTQVERTEGHCPGEGEGEGAPRERAGGGVGAPGGRRPWRAERPQGQVSRRRCPGGGVRAKVPRQWRARPTRGVPGPLAVGEWGQGCPTRRGGGTAPPGVPRPPPEKERAPDQTGLGTRTASPGDWRDPGGEGAPGKSWRPAAVAAGRPPPHPGPRGCQRRCHGRRLFAGARGRAAATDGLAGGPPPPGRPPRAAQSARQPAPRAHASPPTRAPRSKVRLNFDALSLPPPGRSSVAAANQAAAAGAQSRGPARLPPATATAARSTRRARQRAPTGTRRAQCPERASREPRVGAQPRGAETSAE